MRLIDADELRKNVLKWMPSDPCGKEEKEFPFETDICASMVMEIDDAPTVQPERKLGRWIYGESEVGNDGYYCSECGNFVPWIYEESAINFIREYKFCPNCGAKMKDGEADE